MRLIDADKVIKWIEDSVSQYGNTYSTDMLNMFGLFKQYIDNAPTVEPPKQMVFRARDDEELEQFKNAWSKGEINFTPIVAYTKRPTGKWTKGYDGCSHYLFCSECNHSRQIEYYYGEIVYPKFCEDCGAKMERRE